MKERPIKGDIAFILALLASASNWGRCFEKAKKSRQIGRGKTLPGARIILLIITLNKTYWLRM